MKITPIDCYGFAVDEWNDEVTWFAVDRDGCIAVFLPNQCGAVPDRLKIDRLEEECHETFAALRAATGEEVDLDPDLNPDDLDADDLVPAGVYVYWHEGAWLAAPYERNSVPDSPIRTSTLPAAIVANMVVFDGRFADHAELQPVEFWTSRAPVAAWLETGSNRVRCVAGCESAFAAEAQVLEREFPGEYRIEHPQSP